jgi:hypothetical protein
VRFELLALHFQAFRFRDGQIKLHNQKSDARAVLLELLVEVRRPFSFQSP